MCRIISRGDTIIDVGASCGYFTVIFGKLVGNDGKVIAIEPNPEHTAILEHHISVNGINGDVRIAAVSDYSGTATFCEFSASGYGALNEYVDSPENKQFGEAKKYFEVRVTTLDVELDIIGGCCPKLIKIHTCGADLSTLLGASKVLSNSALEFVLLTLSCTTEPNAIVEQMTIRSEMAKYDFDPYVFLQNGEMPKAIPRGTTIMNGGYSHVLFARRGIIEKYYPVDIAIRNDGR